MPREARRCDICIREPTSVFECEWRLAQWIRDLAHRWPTGWLMLIGEISGLAHTMPEMMREVADRVETVTVPRSGHWVAEENPAFLADALLTFVRGGSDDEPDHDARSLEESVSTRR
jgi:pimeloyl-ACP methyl ester carboxylesterase